jgi:sRNA-binding protein
VNVVLKRLPRLAAETRARLSDTREPMKTPKAQRLQGLKESAQAIALLQEKWSRAFPKKYATVKPLARSVKGAVVAGMDWDPYYTSGVLAAWKSRLAYCDAVLRDAIRVDIDGKATDEVVDDTSRAMAAEKRKQVLEGRRRRREARDASKAEDKAKASSNSAAG